jgi:hypothetical protein
MIIVVVIAIAIASPPSIAAAAFGGTSVQVFHLR